MADDRMHFGWPRQGRDRDECRQASEDALRGVWLEITSPRTIECLAAIAGLTGSLLLAAKGEHAAWGWVAFLASNVGWMAFGWIRRHWWLLLQQVGFTATSVLGIWNWMVAS